MDVLFHQSVANWILIGLAAFIIGLSKSGIKGIEMINITIMAIVFGGKASTGVVLPLLCFADLMAVKYYHRHAQWSHFWKLLPWLAIGILIGVFVGKDLDEALFRKVMAVIIIVTVALLLLIEMSKNIKIPENKLFAVSMGLIAGFTTMLGNLGGAFSNIYFLATRMVKNDFIGTAAWIFLVINFFKLPFQVIYWHNITLASLKIDLFLLPIIIVGFLAGVAIVAKIKDNSYRKIVFVLTVIGAIFIFFKR
ncbi:sulfite exporter TauE/SafE family protein [Segetibacter aerophilus]|uniref:Probable membrane transporter protein n=1 Tax=Segetibacter aerophilus TaxID=670293 RepID=A0A512BA17_9BACT|nr:sulfite exporter TauE/SafE family protein [Segetibacter aerophilus]GEO08815.1 anion permease [Segetibacter aerophilus]